MIVIWGIKSNVLLWNWCCWRLCFLLNWLKERCTLQTFIKPRIWDNSILWLWLLLPNVKTSGCDLESFWTKCDACFKTISRRTHIPNVNHCIEIWWNRGVIVSSSPNFSLWSCQIFWKEECKLFSIFLTCLNFEWKKIKCESNYWIFLKKEEIKKKKKELRNFQNNQKFFFFWKKKQLNSLWIIISNKPELSKNKMPPQQKLRMQRFEWMDKMRPL